MSQNTIANLLEIGFIEIGEWKISKKYISGIDYTITNLKSERIVYAFVVGNQIRYIGICENPKTTIKIRLERYRSRAGGNKLTRRRSTNWYVVKMIKKELQRGKRVSIFAFKPPKERFFRGLSIDLIRGLEYSLIHKFSPEWNRKK